MVNETISLKKCSFLVYRAFDLAEEIDLERVQEISELKNVSIGSSITQKGKRLAFTRPTKKTLIVRNPPLHLELGITSIQVGDLFFEAPTSVKFWDYGALTILYRLELPEGTALETLLEISTQLQANVGTEDNIDQIAKKQVSEIKLVFDAAFTRPNHTDLSEDYSIVFIESFESLTPEQGIEWLLKHGPIAELILGEKKGILSTHSKESILEAVFQYAKSDLTVIDWNASVVVEPSGTLDIPDLLEFALSHLLEFRYFDHLIDDKLKLLYDSLERERHTFFRSRFAKLLREANQRFLEISEFTERVNNSLKVVGDYYLAVLFREAIKQFRILDWQNTVTRKNRTLAEISELVEGEMNVFRGHTLELVVIGLITFEVISTIVKSVPH